MRFNSRALLGGRTTVTALSIVAAITIVGATLLSTKAGAQGGGFGQVSISRFGPTELLPAVQREGSDDGTHILIGLLLPAVQRLKEPFRLQIVNDDVNLIVPVEGGEEGRTSTFFDVFTETDANANGLTVHVKNRKTGQEFVKATSSENVTVRLLPAVQRTGRFLNPIASSATVKGSEPMTFGDGSVVPSPFRYALPAVQDEFGG